MSLFSSPPAPLSLLLSLLWLLLTVSTTSAQECDANNPSRCDSHERCRVWKEEGECVLNKAYMDTFCPVSCDGVVTALRKDMEGDNNDDEEECRDHHERCSKWAELGECENNESVMRNFCPKSCGACDDDDDYEIVDDDDDNDNGGGSSKKNAGCKDMHENCAFWAGLGECNSNPNYMHNNCAKSCNTCAPAPKELPVRHVTLLDQSAEFGKKQNAQGSRREETIQAISKSIEYMKSKEVLALPDNIRGFCNNKHELCSFWAVIGECEKNKGYMTTNCGPACHTCQLIDIARRCPIDKNAEPALSPGDLNRMFERIVREAPGNRTLTDEERQHLKEDGMTEYTVQVLSRPPETKSSDVSIVTDKSLPPWVVVFDNFLTDEECEYMIDAGYRYEYKRSEDVGDMKADGSTTGVKSAGRTSENSWCSNRDGCRSEEIPATIHHRIEKVLRIPANNSEDFQMLKYELHQFYNTHHDFIQHQVDRQSGPRILTFFLYLSDVEKGGGTNFPRLDLTVMPKRGRALLWPSILNADPLAIDDRTKHQALPVEAGTKFAANAWIHLFDYITPQENGCS